jgi:hypothetical protein
VRIIYFIIGKHIVLKHFCRISEQQISLDGYVGNRNQEREVGLNSIKEILNENLHSNSNNISNNVFFL